MDILPGASLGRYEIHSLLGAGGMGEVYRARDTKIKRDVAVKILPAAFSADAERLRRFEQEAQTTGALNHPNILTVYDVGTQDGVTYVVTELLEGESLRARLSESPLSPRKAAEYALQVARGLAAAHEKGIAHRDLKPENLFVTKDGRIKILDFGLAKLTAHASAESGAEAPTVLVKTEPGLILGTVGYMSPEQVRAQAVDHRADIFAFGAILYEMLAGRRAFRGESDIETLSAILREDPPALSEMNQSLHPALDRIVRHCLEKKPEERYQSARDLAFDLDMVAGLFDLSSTVTPSAIAPADSPAPAASAAPAHQVARRMRMALAVALTLLAAAVAVGAFYFGQRAGRTQPPSYHQLTFRRGIIRAARFSPDGGMVVYSAAWNGEPLDIFSTRPESPESRAAGLTNADLLAVSATGEMAVLLNRRYIINFISRGTLARIPLTGGAPRELIEDAQQADWSPDGSSLAVVRYVEGRNRLEYPIGHVLYETSGYISFPRVSPDGERVAFLDHQVQWDDRGWVSVVDRAGNMRRLSGEWVSERGLAWSPDGREICFTASRAGEAYALYAVTLAGQERVVARAPVNIMLHDIARDGRVLLSTYAQSTPITGLPPGETRERDLSWLDNVGLRDLSPDGRTFIFSHWGHGSGPNYAVYLRRTDGTPAIRLGDGAAMALSPDGRWALSTLHAPPQIVLLPTGAGEARRLERYGIEEYSWANWLPDGRRVIFMGKEPGQALRCYVQEIAGGAPRPITPEGIMPDSATSILISPDGQFVIVQDSQHRRFLYPVEGGEPRPIAGLSEADVIIRWGADTRTLYVYRRDELPTKIYRLDLSTGRRQLIKEIMPADLAGIVGPLRVLLTPDGRGYVYLLSRYLSDLYLAEGLMSGRSAVSD